MEKISEKIVEEIRKYYFSPKKYAGDTEKIKSEIDKLDKFLLSSNTEELEEKDIFTSLFEKYKDKMEDIIRTTLDGNGGSSLTKNYYEIYFNEIIQNANDNTNGNKMNIKILRTGEEQKMFELSFCYKDRGFHTKDIIGFFTMENHHKTGELESTGKHGVGIKSLFYFVEHLTIESNVLIDIEIKKLKNEDKEEKIGDINITLEKKEEWDGNTTLTIKFPQKENYDGEFNIKKLIGMIDAVLNKKDKELLKYFFSEEQKEIVFDIRGLLFTDKNCGKEYGIKKITLNQYYTLSCEEKECVNVKMENSDDDYYACKAELVLDKGDSLDSREVIKRWEYFLLTRKGTQNKQSFSMAFPLPSELSMGQPRYYETYYIPYSDDKPELKLNILVNSEYSDVSRTKLAEQDKSDSKELKEIHQKIKEEIIKGLELMTSEEFSKACGKVEIKKDVSRLFYTMLSLNPGSTDFTNEEEEKGKKFVELCCDKNISNRYLLKREEEDINKYLVYKREAQEEYEHESLQQEKSVDEIKNFMESTFLKEDSIDFSQDTKVQFLKEVEELYTSAFKEENYKMRKILNAVGSIKDLIYYRITNSFPENKESVLDDRQVDSWNEKLYDEMKENTTEEAKEKVEDSLLVIGRYKLNKNISINGKIHDASLYDYIFSKGEYSNQSMPYPSLRSKAKEKYDKYQKLISYLKCTIVNPGKEDCQGRIFKKATKEATEKFAEKENKKFFNSPNVVSKTPKDVQTLEGKKESYKKNYFPYACQGYNCSGYICLYTSKHENAKYLYYIAEDMKEPASLDLMDDVQKRKEFFQNQKDFMELLSQNNCDNEIVKHMIRIKNYREGKEDWHWYLYGDILKYYGGWQPSPSHWLPSDWELGETLTADKIFSLQHTIWLRLKLLQLDSLIHIQASNWKEFKYYFELFEKLKEQPRIQTWFYRSCKQPYLKTTDDFSMESDELTDVFQFFYSGEHLSMQKTEKFQFKVKLTKEPSYNLCRKDIHDFIMKMTKKAIYVMQTNQIQNKMEIMYAYNKELYVMTDKDNKVKIGEYDDELIQTTQDGKDMLIIIHNGKCGPEEAIYKVLKKINIENDSIEKCKAFISAESLHTMQGIEYNEFQNRVADVNMFHRPESLEKSAQVPYMPSELNCKSLKKIILARGNNDGKCACCGDNLRRQDGAEAANDGAKAELIITYNESKESQQRYPLIYNVVCSKCKKILSKSLKKAYIEHDEESKKLTIVYNCVAENAHQKKDVIWKSVLYPGIAALCSTEHQ